MDVKVGDEMVVEGVHVGDMSRKGEVLEVIGGDVVQYRVRWDDGHETIFFPGSDAHVVHLGARGRPDRR
jgi:Domain of unknown function (DUF1918)